MTTAIFYRVGAVLTGFSVSGHSGYAESGRDIVCAAISACVEMCANGVTEIAGVPAAVTAEGDVITLATDAAAAQPFLRALELELRRIAEQYPRKVRVSTHIGRPH